MRGGEQKSLVTMSLSILVVLLLAVCVFLFIQMSSAKKTASEAKSSLEVLQRNFDSMKKTYDTMRADYSSMEAKLGELSGNYGTLQKRSDDVARLAVASEVKLDKALTKLYDFELTVNESMSWFKTNTNLNNTGNFTELKKQVIDECIDTNKDSDVCNIKLDCLFEAISSNRVIYKSDDFISTKSDWLQSLDDIYRNHGGDCDDFALIYSATYNYAAAECESQGYSRDQFVLSDSYYNDLGGAYVYAICGVFDPKQISYGYSGHCVVAFTGTPIIDSTDLYLRLKDSVVVEPQTGEFWFYMNDTDIIVMPEDAKPVDSLYYVSMVMTDNDLKIFYQWSEDVGWVGYADFRKDILGLKAELVR